MVCERNKGYNLNSVSEDGKISPSHGLVGLNIIRMPIYQNSSTYSMQPFSEILTQFFTNLNRTILSFIWKLKKPRIAKAILNNTRIVGSLSISNLILLKSSITKKRMILT